MPPKYAVCPVTVLAEAYQQGKKWQKPVKSSSDSPSVGSSSSVQGPGASNGVLDGFYSLTYSHPATHQHVHVRCNSRGRLVLTIENGRDIIVLWLPKERLSLEAGGPQSDESRKATKPVRDALRHGTIYALDRHCYHVGYPMDLGDIEEHPLPVRPGTNAGRSSNKSAAEGSELGTKVDLAGTEDDFDLSVYVRCINCPLHNRIFDLETGDMMAMLPLSAIFPTASDAPKDQFAPASSGCYQRVHQIYVMSPSEMEANEVFFAAAAKMEGSSVVAPPPSPSQETLWVVIEDSHGCSNPLPVDVSKPRHENEEVLYLDGKRLPSDSYNRPDGIQFEDKSTGEQHSSKKARVEKQI